MTNYASSQPGLADATCDVISIATLIQESVEQARWKRCDFCEAWPTDSVSSCGPSP